MSEKIKNESLPNKAHERQVRRFLWAPSHRLAAIVPPELSSLCMEELNALSITGTEITEAGVEFLGGLNDCYRCNLWLRTASRVLCRFPVFRAGAVEELFNKVSGLRWELWLSPALPLHLETFVNHSRIEHEGTAKETVLSGIERRFRMHHLHAPPRWEGVEEEHPPELGSIREKQRILVHLRENRCEISLDTTGAHLHQRGYRLQHTGAPLRETLAAALLIKAGWSGDSPLVDGMCGAGTIAIEAALLARRMPPGGRRSFLFEQWPSFREEHWAYLRRKGVEQALLKAKTRIVALDLSEQALGKARQNGLRAGVEKDIEWACTDFFSFEPREHHLDPGWLLLNPPYGKRLEGGGKPFYERLGLHLRSSFKGWHIAVLAPDRATAIALRLPAMRFWNITHGGIPIVAVMARL